PPTAPRLRTQWVSPNGLMTPRRPLVSQIVTGVVRGRPVVRPGTVSKTSGPSGTPGRRRGAASRLKYGTQNGRRRDSSGEGAGPDMRRNQLTRMTPRKIGPEAASGGESGRQTGRDPGA